MTVRPHNILPSLYKYPHRSSHCNRLIQSKRSIPHSLSFRNRLSPSLDCESTMRAPKLKSVAQKKINPEMLKKRKAGEEKPKKVSNKEAGAPKRPVTAFLIFMEEFRKSFKENFPDNKSIAIVGKAGGEKWKSLSEKDKSPYVAKAKLKKVDYEKALEEFKLKKAGNPVIEEKSEGSEKSSSDTHEEVACA